MRDQITAWLNTLSQGAALLVLAIALAQGWPRWYGVDRFLGLPYLCINLMVWAGVTRMTRPGPLNVAGRVLARAAAQLQLAVAVFLFLDYTEYWLPIDLFPEWPTVWLRIFAPAVVTVVYYTYAYNLCLAVADARAARRCLLAGLLLVAHMVTAVVVGMFRPEGWGIMIFWGFYNPIGGVGFGGAGAIMIAPLVHALVRGQVDMLISREWWLLVAGCLTQLAAAASMIQLTLRLRRTA